MLLKEKNEKNFLDLVNISRKEIYTKKRNKQLTFNKRDITKHGIKDYYMVMSAEQRNISINSFLGIHASKSSIFDSEISKSLRSNDTRVVECDLVLRDSDMVILARNYRKSIYYKEIEIYQIFKDGMGLKIKGVDLPYYFLFEDIYKNRIEFIALFKELLINGGDSYNVKLLVTKKRDFLVNSL